MSYVFWWFLLWWGSTFLQLYALILAIQLWHRSPTYIWRCLWMAFVIHWLFMLSHQFMGVMLAAHPHYLPMMITWLMKLGAMGGELVVMRLAWQLMHMPPQTREERES
jgi:hypothetical protein